MRSRTPRLLRVFLVAVLVAVAVLAFSGQLGAQPDPRQMSGLPLPSGDLPVGTVSVRVIRGQLSNNVPAQPVALTVDEVERTVKTDESGRAQFTDLPVGRRVRAATVLDGERIESQEFTIPAQGGVRLMLVASEPVNGSKGTTAAPKPQPGTVALGGESRFIFELGEEAFQVFYLMDIVNSAAAPVMTERPMVFDLPRGAQGAAVLRESKAQGVVQGNRLVVNGPFQPGITSLQVGFTLLYSGDRAAFQQTLPVGLGAVNVIVEKTGALRASSVQLGQQREMTADGRTYIVGNGPGIAANGTLTLELEGLPHAAAWPRQLTLGLAALVLALGFWAALGMPQDVRARTDDLRQLLQRRERLFDELLRLDEQADAGRGDRATYPRRRQAMIKQLEHVYARLDEDPAAAVVGVSSGVRGSAPQRSSAAR